MVSFTGFPNFGTRDKNTIDKFFGRRLIVDRPSHVMGSGKTGKISSHKIGNTVKTSCRQVDSLKDNKRLLLRTTSNQFLINNTGKQWYCNVSDRSKDVAGDGKKVDPSLFTFQKWGITWNAVGLYVASLVGCYWNIFTEDGAFALVLVLQCYVISLVFPVQLTQAFLAMTRVRVVDWYFEQGLKIEQELRRNFLFWGFLVCGITFLCLASSFGGPFASHEAAILLRISRGVTFSLYDVETTVQTDKGSK